MVWKSMKSLRMNKSSLNLTSTNAVRPELVEGLYSEKRMLLQAQHERKSALIDYSTNLREQAC